MNDCSKCFTRLLSGKLCREVNPESNKNAIDCVTFTAVPSQLDRIEQAVADNKATLNRLQKAVEEQNKYLDTVVPRIKIVYDLMTAWIKAAGIERREPADCKNVNREACRSDLNCEDCDGWEPKE